MRFSQVHRIYSKSSLKGYLLEILTIPKFFMRKSKSELGFQISMDIWSSGTYYMLLKGSNLSKLEKLSFSHDSNGIRKFRFCRIFRQAWVVSVQDSLLMFRRFGHSSDLGSDLPTPVLSMSHVPYQIGYLSYWNILLIYSWTKSHKSGKIRFHFWVKWNPEVPVFQSVPRMFLDASDKTPLWIFSLFSEDPTPCRKIRSLKLTYLMSQI